VAADRWLQQTHPPEAFVIPDTSLAVRVMSAMQRRNRPIASDSIVIGATRSSAEQCGCGHLPRMTSDSMALTRTSLDLLRWQARGDAARPCTLVLPHTFDNKPTSW
jgi:DNA-binding LacI/PurR family transcriptional regulator